MNDQSALPGPATPDWGDFLRSHEAAGVPEIDLTELKPGDRLLVLTEHTAYALIVTGPLTAEATPNRPDRPSGPIVFRGCTFGASSSIKPHHIFCGGNLEFEHGIPPQITTTTTIRALRLTRASPL